MSDLPTALHTAAQVRALDRHAIDVQGIPGYELMCRAGEAALRVIQARWPVAHRILVVCGGGNNGGDGYVVARLARAARLDASVAAVTSPERLRGDARRAWEDAVKAGVPIGEVNDEALVRAHLIVDALFGTGLDRPLDRDTGELIERINFSGVPILSLDVPSGLHADTGQVMGAAVRATRTISFIALKVGCYLGQGPDYTGVLEFASLDVRPPPELSEPLAERITPALIATLLPRRPRTAHKGLFGHVLIVGGGPGMPGAVRLCGTACLRAGAGLVTVATRAQNLAAVVSGRPELMCHAIDDVSTLAVLIERADVIVAGPGLGQDAWAEDALTAVLDAPRPLVLDADALNLLVHHRRRLENWIITPHPGEAARLLGTSTQAVQDDRLGAVKQLVAVYGGVAVLKGACTLVGSASRPPAVCDRGNPGMATPGMGDVLSGIIAALFAQSGDAWGSARAGVLAHAMAGDAAARRGERGLIASDLIAELPGCLNPQT